MLRLQLPRRWAARGGVMVSCVGLAGVTVQVVVTTMVWSGCAGRAVSRELRRVESSEQAQTGVGRGASTRGQCRPLQSVGARVCGSRAGTGARAAGLVGGQGEPGMTSPGSSCPLSRSLS
jgi:hypothetical protein